VYLATARQPTQSRESLNPNLKKKRVVLNEVGLFSKKLSPSMEVSACVYPSVPTLNAVTATCFGEGFIWKPGPSAFGLGLTTWFTRASNETSPRSRRAAGGALTVWK
jgi:hypothetical protein